ncbi:MAG: sigma 54-interacting transcriptional regulator [Bdellovibrionales bacterium]|nr:sigma 54-interacting transcriptional regulator [Bdellovibrionales bacterium]
MLERQLKKIRRSLLALLGRGQGVGWEILLRMCILGPLLIAGIALSIGDASTNRMNHFMMVLPGSLYVFSLLSIIWLHLRKGSPWFVSLQILADVFFVSALIYVTGGPISPFLFLYLPVVMSASVFKGRNMALAFTSACFISYGCLIYSMLGGYLTPLDPAMSVFLPTGGLLVQLLGLVSAMALTAVATTFLMERLRLSVDLIEQSRKDLADITNRQSALMHELPEGVVITDLDDTITFMNRAALDLFQIGADEVVGLDFQDLLAEMSPEWDENRKNKVQLYEQESVTLTRTEGEEPLHLVFTTRPLSLEGGREPGVIYIFQDVTKLKSVQDQLALQERMARLLSERVDEPQSIQTKFDYFVGETVAMKQIFRLIERIARTDATVLITGESGTGKELVARAVHMGGARGNAPFVAVNCGAIPENLIESELFGHRKGAFTGADQEATGLFRRAEGGTIFLDEIGELPLHMQTKLLRVIQEKTVRPVGGDREIPIHVRIISATNRNLKEEVARGNFREDLYYRLNVVSIQIPALRQRREDVPVLVKCILKRLVKDETEIVMSPQAMDLLMKYDYPGNVRELENIIERGLVLGGSVILPEHLPDTVRSYQRSASENVTNIIIDDDLQLPCNLDLILADFERRYLEEALKKSNGVKKKAAHMLGMNFRSFRYRLQKFDL